MSYALQTKPVTSRRLVKYFDGATLELRERDFGDLSDLSVGARMRGENPSQAVLAAALHVNGVPMTLERLRALPGHLSVALTELMAEAMRMHGMGPEDEDEDDDGDVETPIAAANADSAPGESTPRLARAS